MQCMPWMTSEERADHGARLISCRRPPPQTPPLCMHMHGFVMPVTQSALRFCNEPYLLRHMSNLVNLENYLVGKLLNRL